MECIASRSQDIVAAKTLMRRAVVKPRSRLPPASEAAFIIESRNIYRGGPKTVLHGILSFLGMAQDAACNEVE